MVFYNNLKFCREEIELTQRELGDIFGVSQFTVHGWENGHDTMPLDKLITFSNLYGYSVNFILGLSSDKSKCSTKINTSKEQVGRKLHYIRTKLNLTQASLAEECNIARTTYSEFEEGKHLINTITLYIICSKYNISADWMLDRNNKIYLNNKKD